MIKLFVSDLDGCITQPFESPDWDAISRIRELNHQSGQDPAIPPLTLCTGRPLPYVEAVAQWLDVQYPFIFESGGGVYDMRNNKIIWSPRFDEEAREIIKDLKEWVRTEIIDQYPGTIPEFAKQTDVGLINPSAEACHEMFELVREHVHSHYDIFEVHYTDVSVNVILKASNKGAGLRQLSDLTGIPTDAMAYIGDSSGDVSAMREAQKAYAPDNAKEIAKAEAEVLGSYTTEAVLEAYQNIVDYNKEQLEISEKAK